MKRTNDPRQMDLLTMIGAEPDPGALFRAPIAAPAAPAAALAIEPPKPDFHWIVAQETAKRALEIAVVGGLSVMLRGNDRCPLPELQDAAAQLALEADLPLTPRVCLTDGKVYERADIFVDVEPTHEADLRLPPPAEFNQEIAPRVRRACWKLFELCPAYPDHDAVAALLTEDPARRLWRQAVEAMQLDEAGQRAALRTAVVIAACAASPTLGRVHVAEALSYRHHSRMDDPPAEQEPEPEAPAPQPEPQPGPEWPEGAVRASDPVHASDERPYWKTSAYQYGGEILARPDKPPPIELTVRGIATVVAFGFGFATHAVGPPGTPYWSDTGFRSFTTCPETDPDAIRAIIEAYIDAPAKGGNGCGGKLAPWWTLAVRQLQQHRAWMGRTEGGPDTKMLAVDAEKADAVRAEGFNPDRVAPLPKKLRKAA